MLVLYLELFISPETLTCFTVPPDKQHSQYGMSMVFSGGFIMFVFFHTLLYIQASLTDFDKVFLRNLVAHLKDEKHNIIFFFHFTLMHYFVSFYHIKSQYQKVCAYTVTKSFTGINDFAKNCKDLALSNKRLIQLTFFFRSADIKVSLVSQFFKPQLSPSLKMKYFEPRQTVFKLKSV